MLVFVALERCENVSLCVLICPCQGPSTNHLTLPHHAHTQGEDVPTYEAIAAVLARDPQHVYKRYDTMEHGWCGARAKYDDVDVVAQIDDARSIIARFFTARL